MIAPKFAETVPCPDHPRWLPLERWRSGQASTAPAKPCPTPIDQDLNSREIAGLVWLGILAAFLLVLATRQRNVGLAMLGVLRALLLPAFVGLAVISLAWAVVTTAVLAKVDLWRWDNLKTTVVWALTFVPVSIAEYEKAKAGKSFVRSALIDIAGATVFVQFLVDEYTFPLVVELLLLPTLTFVALIQVVAQRDPAHRSVAKLASFILTLAGFCYVGNAVLQLIKGLGQFASFDTAREFLVPILLSVAYLPVVYLLAVYASYEVAMLGLDWAIEDERVRAFARRQAMTKIGLRLDLLRRWSREVASTQPKTMQAVRETIRTIQSNAAQALHTPPVFIDEGWSPHVAKDYLAASGLVTGDYHASFGEWWASTPLVEVGEGLFPDNLSYYVEGDARTADRLRLKLNVNNPGGETPSLARFQALAVELIKAATGETLSAAAEAALAPLNPAAFETGPVVATLSRENYASGGIPDGYTLTLALRPRGKAQPA